MGPKRKASSLLRLEFIGLARHNGAFRLVWVPKTHSSNYELTYQDTDNEHAVGDVDELPCMPGWFGGLSWKSPRDSEAPSVRNA